MISLEQNFIRKENAKKILVKSIENYIKEASIFYKSELLVLRELNDCLLDVFVSSYFLEQLKKSKEKEVKKISIFKKFKRMFFMEEEIKDPLLYWCFILIRVSVAFSMGVISCQLFMRIF